MTFYPCNTREAKILARLAGNKLKDYELLRHKGATVTEALEKVESTGAGIGHRIGWLDSVRMPSHIHRTTNNGKTTVCGHVPGDNNWILAEVPRKDHGSSRYCPTCFRSGGKSLPWLKGTS